MTTLFSKSNIKTYKNIEIVPNTITATVVVDSPNKTVPINVVPVGNVASGSAISSITPNVANVTLYGDSAALKEIESIDVEINVEGLSQDKTYQETIVKPNGVRSMSETALTIKVVMEKETSKEFEGISVVFEGLDTSKYDAKAANVESTKIDVVVKGVKTLLDKIKPEDIQAVVDLKDLKEGTWEVPVTIKGNDNKLVYTSRTNKVKIVIKKK